MIPKHTHQLVSTAVAVLLSLPSMAGAQASAPHLSSPKDPAPTSTQAVSWFGLPHYRGQGLVVPIFEAWDFEQVPCEHDGWTFAPKHRHRYLKGGSPIAIDPAADATHTLRTYQSEDGAPTAVFKDFFSAFTKEAKGKVTTLAQSGGLLAPLGHLREIIPGAARAATDQVFETEEGHYLNPIVRLAPGRNALLLRLRREFQYVNEDVPGVEAVWNRDNIAGTDGWQFRGALMADVYLDALYNSNLGSMSGRAKGDRYPASIFLRFGAEWDYNDMLSDSQSDVRRFYMMGSMWMNQAQKLGDGAQFVQAGAIYEDDALRGVNQWRWTVSWEPRFNTGAGKKADGETKAKQPMTPVGVKRFFGDGERHYWFINPKLDYSAVQQVIAQHDYASLGDQQVGVNVQAGLSLWNEKLLLRYLGRHYWSAGDWGDSHTYHEVRADVWLGNQVHEHSFWTSAARAPRLFMSYRYGEDAPSYSKVDFLSAGVSIRF